MKTSLSITAQSPMSKAKKQTKIKHEAIIRGWSRWHPPVISALEKLREEGLKFGVSLGYTGKTCL